MPIDKAPQPRQIASGISILSEHQLRHRLDLVRSLPLRTMQASDWTLESNGEAQMLVTFNTGKLCHFRR